MAVANVLLNLAYRYLRREGHMKGALIAIVCGVALLAPAMGQTTSRDRVAPNAASATFSASRVDVLFAFSDAAALVPEPATLSLLGVALLGAAWAAKKRRRAKKGSPQV